MIYSARWTADTTAKTTSNAKWELTMILSTPYLKHRIFAFMLAITTTPIAFADSISCIEKYARFTDAQIRWQNDSATIATQLLPKHEKRITFYRDTQLIAIERRRLAVTFVMEHFPEKLSTWGSLNQWLDLTPALEKQLSDISPRFRDLSNQYREKISQPTPDATDTFQQTYRKTVLADRDFTQLMQTFNLASREINSLHCE
ncbi:MAG: hypothetical protein ACJAZ4_001938 [Neptuniibacter pectenicola]|jgi:hypothetical protein|uniref:hypothetical protein n=1 Tax=Neptuniibacter pectenicola TaxID=1806669 RepID=UPI0030EB21A3|tara:strand:- start:1137 stop:1742 length:606 start_codon:yes stop_codon:yes gene_type:complete